MKKYIHIHAKCQAFEIFELVEESKVIKRLKTIRDAFEFSRKKFMEKFDDNLWVSTIKVNPELPFVNY